MKIPLSTALALSCLVGCATTTSAPPPSNPAPVEAPEAAPAPPAEAPPQVDAGAALFEALQGHFTSEIQAKAAPENYYPVELFHCPIDIEGGTGSYLYVEQRLIGKSPYRQRVYRIESGKPSDQRARSVIYAIPDEEAAEGFCEGKATLALKASDLIEKEGCVVELVLYDGTFQGATRGKECKNSLRDAVYATTELTINPRGIMSWDKGFNAADEQVWGPELGAYDFVRVGEGE